VVDAARGLVVTNHHIVGNARAIAVGLGDRQVEAELLGSDPDKLQIRDFNPAEISPGEFSQIVQRVVDENEVRVVLIDSFTGYLSALPKSDQAVMQIQSLVKYLSRRGVLSILIVANHGLLGHNVTSDIDVSFLGDAVLLRMYEWPGFIHRSVTVVKKRHGPHDLNVHELVIRPDGVSVQAFNPPPPEQVVRCPMSTVDHAQLEAAPDHVLVVAPFRSDADTLTEALGQNGMTAIVCAEESQLGDVEPARLVAARVGRISPHIGRPCSSRIKTMTNHNFRLEDVQSRALLMVGDPAVAERTSHETSPCRYRRQRHLSNRASPGSATGCLCRIDRTGRGSRSDKKRLLVRRDRFPDQGRRCRQRYPLLQ